MKKSIRAKLTLLVAIIIVLVVIIQLGFDLRYAETYFIQEKSGQIEKLYDKLKEAIANNDMRQVNTLANIYEEKHHIWTIIWSENGENIYTKDFGELSAYMQDYSFYDTPLIEKSNENLTMSGIIDGSDTEYYVLLGSSVSAVHHSVKLIFELNVKISIFAVIIGMIGAWIAGKKFTKPILEIDKVAKAVTKLDFSQTVELTAREDEIGTLGNNINLMSAHLSDAMEKLQLANAQLEKDIIHQKNLDKMRKEFIANVSHELKSPLALLTMSCANLKDVEMQEKDKSFYYDVIMDECLRLGTLVQNLLEISKLDNATEIMQKETFNFSDFVEWVLSKYFVVFKEKELRIKAEIEPNIYVLGSKAYLEQAIINYLDNAVNHTEKKGRIEIFLKPDNGQAIFSVFNLGMPIKEEFMERIWDSFYSLDTARTHNEDMHAGLGLYIVKTIIEAHDGKYGVSNEKNGVTFWFSLNDL